MAAKRPRVCWARSSGQGTRRVTHRTDFLWSFFLSPEGVQRQGADEQNLVGLVASDSSFCLFVFLFRAKEKCVEKTLLVGSMGDLDGVTLQRQQVNAQFLSLKHTQKLPAHG